MYRIYKAFICLRYLTDQKDLIDDNVFLLVPGHIYINTCIFVYPLYRI